MREQRRPRRKANLMTNDAPTVGSIPRREESDYVAVEGPKSTRKKEEKTGSCRSGPIFPALGASRPQASGGLVELLGRFVARWTRLIQEEHGGAWLDEICSRMKARLEALDATGRYEFASEKEKHQVVRANCRTLTRAVIAERGGLLVRALDGDLQAINALLFLNWRVLEWMNARLRTQDYDAEILAGLPLRYHRAITSAWKELGPESYEKLGAIAGKCYYWEALDVLRRHRVIGGRSSAVSVISFGELPDESPLWTMDGAERLWRVEKERDLVARMGASNDLCVGGWDLDFEAFTDDVWQRLSAIEVAEAKSLGQAIGVSLARMQEDQRKAFLLRLRYPRFTEELMRQHFGQAHKKETVRTWVKRARGILAEAIAEYLRVNGGNGSTEHEAQFLGEVRRMVRTWEENERSRKVQEDAAYGRKKSQEKEGRV